MKLTKEQKKEIQLEKYEKNKEKYIREGREYSEISLKERNIMKSTDPKYYQNIKDSYHKVMNKEIRGK